MCRNCWIEAGEPRIEAPELRALAERMRSLDTYRACHPVVKDWNVDDQNIAYCLTEGDITPGETDVLRELLALPEGHRYSVLAMSHGHF